MESDSIEEKQQDQYIDKAKRNVGKFIAEMGKLSKERLGDPYCYHNI